MIAHDVAFDELFHDLWPSPAGLYFLSEESLTLDTFFFKLCNLFWLSLASDSNYAEHVCVCRVIHEYITSCFELLSTIGLHVFGGGG